MIAISFRPFVVVVVFPAIIASLLHLLSFQYSSILASFIVSMESDIAYQHYFLTGQLYQIVYQLCFSPRNLCSRAFCCSILE